MYDEDELLWANNGEGFSHDPGPREVPMRLSPVINRSLEPQFNSPGRNFRIRAMPERFADPARMMREKSKKEENAIEEYDAMELEANREEEPANLPFEAEVRSPGELMAGEPVMEIGTADGGCRPTRVRTPPVRLGIDEFVS